jgi:hypothetical protein
MPGQRLVARLSSPYLSAAIRPIPTTAQSGNLGPNRHFPPYNVRVCVSDKFAFPTSSPPAAGRPSMHETVL